ncbi:MAG: hypothetical protein AAF604_19235 [Acidobacteriota bacterium]
MSAAYFVELEQDIEGFDPFVNGKSLALVEGILSAQCEDLGVVPMINFVVVPADQLADFLVGEGLEDLAEQAGQVATHWFDPAQDRATFSALVSWLRREKGTPATAGIEAPEDVLRDLEEIEAVLQRAEKAGVRWRLAVDY